MNNITIIEFGFRIISRIMEILEGVIGLDPYDFSDDTKPEGRPLSTIFRGDVVRIRSWQNNPST